MNRIILATIFLLASTFSYATIILTATATGDGGKDKDGHHLVYFTLAYEAGQLNNNSYIDQVWIDLPGNGDDTFEYTFYDFLGNLSGSGTVNIVETVDRSDVLTLDFLAKNFVSGQTLEFSVGVHAACTNDAEEKCTDFDIKKNSGAVLGHLGSTISASFVNKDTGVSEIYASTFITTSKNIPSTSTASVSVPVPEPGSIVLLLAGIFGLSFLRCKARS